MRTEAEVKQMIAELEQITDIYGKYTAQAIIAALYNVLNGPTTYISITGCACLALYNALNGPTTYGYACLGPAGCCMCTINRLASKQDKYANTPSE